MTYLYAVDNVKIKFCTHLGKELLAKTCFIVEVFASRAFNLTTYFFSKVE